MICARRIVVDQVLSAPVAYPAAALQFRQIARQERLAETLPSDVKNGSKRYIAPGGASDTDGRNLTGRLATPLVWGDFSRRLSIW
jgi:hypothetical protein